MKKLFGVLIALSAFTLSRGQDSLVLDPQNNGVIDTLPLTDPSDLIEETQEERKKLNISQLGITNRSKDHLLIQVGYESWAQKPDSISTSGLPRSFSMYFMFDFPFKTNPKLSVAVGAGISTSNMYFSETIIDIAGRLNTNQLSFRDVSDTNRFKKYKLMTTYLEAPVELRYTADPLRPKKSLKAAIGLKVGTMLSATTKGKTLQNSSGQTITAFTQKEKSKRFFNGTRISVMGRVGIGSLSLFGSYQINAFIKEGFGPNIRPFTIGLTLSGL